MLPSSNVRVVKESADRLVVLIPPYYSAAFVLCLFAAIPLAFLLMTMRRHSSLVTRLFMCGMAAVELLVALLIGTYKTVVILSRSNDAVEVHRSIVGLTTTRKTFRLHDVLEFGTATSVGSAIEAVLRNGEQVSITSAATNQGGYTGVVHVMNEFLKHRSAP
jgi:hypothetical protein